MIEKKAVLIFGAALGILILPLRGATATETVLLCSEVAQTIVIDDPPVQDGSVSGTVVSKSSATVQDVELLIPQMWLWNEEFYPGTGSPGRALFSPLRRDVAPYASASFTFQTPPLPQRSVYNDGGGHPSLPLR